MGKARPAIKAAAWCCVLVVTMGAHSDDGVAAARAAYSEGRFLEAAELAGAAGTSQGHALAAMCLRLHGHYLAPADEKRGLFERAMALADEAIRLDPDNPDAYLQSARSIGRYARVIGNLEAARQGLGGKARDLMQAALERDPDESVAHLSIAGWHADIVAAGFLARAMFKDANKADAVKHYERALQLAPESKLVRLEYARRLPRLDRRGGRARARALLAEAAALVQRDFHDEILQGLVLKELASLD